tara:strand:- start:507 stop:1316 length:810 start_codon:yes stop_codon:yes gene_type:complete
MKNKQKIYFITYGSKEFNTSKKHLLNLAKLSNIFEKCIGFEQKDLTYQFKKDHKEILSEDRGGGFWIWKHEIINMMIKSLNKDDLIVYCDAGTSFNYHAKNRFIEYIEMINDSKFSNFRIESEKQNIEKNWTTKEIFRYFDTDVDSEIGNSTQFEGGHLIFKSNNDSVEYFQEYKKLLKADLNLITDFYNNSKQIDGFQENRHDQSIFSMLSKIRGCVSIENETKFQNKLDDQFMYPFLSIRVRGHGMKDKFKYAVNFKNTKNTPRYFK